ncbi:MAG: hypothetical protein Q9214_001288 [Letrouitia sp. 1 TL-2023]
MTTNGQQVGRSASILFGSETGNACDYAEEFGRISERLHFHTTVAKLNDVKPSSLAQFSFVVIIISTTGQGDVPFNARTFWKELLRKKLPLSYLQNVTFTTFGLGDSSYPKFNWAARKLHKRLLQLSANEFYPRGEANERHDEGLDASWVPWSTDLRYHLLQKFPLGEGFSPIPDNVLLEPRWLLATTPEVARIGDAGKNARDDVQLSEVYAPINKQGLTQSSIGHALNSSTNEGSVQLDAVLQMNRRLTPESHWQDVRHLEFSSPVTARYGPGDVLSIQPQNAIEDVQSMLKMMGWEEVADQQIAFAPTKQDTKGLSVPAQTVPFHNHSSLTLRKLLTDYVDLTAIPRRSFFSLIAHFTNDPLHKERLLEFADTKYIDELYDYTTRPRRSVLEVLQEFDSVKVPSRWAAAVLPELRGRQFSIASGGQLKHGPSSGTHFDLLVAIVRYKTVIKKFREGVCTRYLAGLSAGTKLRVTLQKGSLSFKKAEAKRPVVMIAPGTGVAPMRSLIWERYMVHLNHKPDTNDFNGARAADFGAVGETVLIYGCRNADVDHFFREEWDSLKEKMPLQVYTAFSRDQVEKIYVQDIIREQAALVYRLLYLSGGTAYVCGSSGRMPQAVRASLTDAFQKAGNMQANIAEEFLELLEKEGRYKQETW